MKYRGFDEFHETTFLYLQQHEVCSSYVCMPFSQTVVLDLLTLYLLMAYCKVGIVTQVLWCHSEDELCASRKGEFVQ